MDIKQIRIDIPELVEGEQEVTITIATTTHSGDSPKLAEMLWAIEQASLRLFAMSGRREPQSPSS